MRDTPDFFLAKARLLMAPAAAWSWTGSELADLNPAGIYSAEEK
jgi:hypothetical protein